MDMQQMPMGGMSMGNVHDSFWRDDQVTILFQSASPLVVDGKLNKEPEQELPLRQYVDQLSKFLKRHGVPVTLRFLDDSDHPKHKPMPHDTSGMSNMADTLQLPAGVYAFGFTTPIDSPSPFGSISTSFISFLQIEQHSSRGGSGNASMDMPVSGEDDSDDKCKDPTRSLVSQIVKKLNEHLPALNSDEQIPITIAAPVWLTGGTPSDTGQGCPLSPPIPVKDSCSNWHIRLPDLSPDLKSKKGNGVTVFVLDSFPEKGVIERAARDAGDDNLLLRKVNETVEFDYSFMSGIQDVQEIGATNGTFVGKDVYGRHYPIRLEDHGLFIAGIVRDLVPRARIECIRVLDDLCVGDLNVIANALNQIYFRKALQSGDLYGKLVVVNLSLVIPTDDEACSQGVDAAIGGSNNVWSNLKQAIQSLTELGVIVVASAGNEGDLRESPGINRPMALYPAKFAYAPYSVDGIIPVGAVDKHENPSSYSCYPGTNGVATYGGEVPDVTPSSPPNPPSSNIDVKISDAPRGIYSSVEYPPLLSDPPEQYYTAPNDHAWAYWVGTSFATPIISALAARVLEAGGGIPDILNAASDTTQWDRLDSSYSTSSTAPGKMLRAVQHCVRKDRDDKDDEEVDVEVISVVQKGEEVDIEVIDVVVKE